MASEATVELSSKVCTRCKFEKVSSEFTRRTRSKDGLSDWCISCSRQYYLDHRQERIAKAKTYRDTHKEATNIQQRNRRQTDSLYRIKNSLRSRFGIALRNRHLTKRCKLSQYLGCTVDELKVHLEKQFKTGMTWFNYGEWHIDHIRPLNSAQNEEELYKLCHYTNLQPLWALDNIKKGSKFWMPTCILNTDN